MRRAAAGSRLTGSLRFVLEQDTLILACTGSTHEDPSLFNCKIVDGT